MITDEDIKNLFEKYPSLHNSKSVLHSIKRLKNKRLADLNLSELKHLDEPLAP